MTLVAPELPSRFPCWVRAVYSWGGETKRDLGFVEGDLIECLNAGDGSWWMGRLKRDRRMVGLFPSNFVEVLEDAFQPGGDRAISPMPQRRLSTQPPVEQSTPQKQKSMFRKPFQAYHSATSPNPQAAERDRLDRTGSTTSSRSPGSFNSHRPFSSMKRPSSENSQNTRSSPQLRPRQSTTDGQLRPVSPRPPHPLSRPVSPGVFSQLRAASPAPYSRAASPAPTSTLRSDGADWDDRSSPPPAPPPHRYANSRAPSPLPPAAQSRNGYTTPEPRSPIPQNFTPSPLTNAMNDVMQCLEDIDVSRREEAEEWRAPDSTNVWSPEAFNEIYASSRRHRPHTVLGYADQARDDEQHGATHGNDVPYMDDYVQRMESRLKQLHDLEDMQTQEVAPEVPPKNDHPTHGNLENLGRRLSQKLRHRKSAFELGKGMLNRTLTSKTSKTTATESSSATHHTLASVTSAGAFSATSAGSYYRKQWANGDDLSRRPVSMLGMRSAFGEPQSPTRPSSPGTGISYHSSHATEPGAYGTNWTDSVHDNSSLTGGLTTPRARKSGFFKKMIESARTGAANARSTISSSSASRPSSPIKSRSSGFPNGVTSIAGGMPVQSRPTSSAARSMGLGDASDWMQVRRDVNRSNTISRNERQERAERCQLLDLPAIAPVDELYHTSEGNEGLDGLPVTESADFSSCNLSLVDKHARFVDNIPAFITPMSLAQGYLCRPYRSDVQRLRAIFSWVSEKIAWEEAFDAVPDSRRVIQQRRGCAHEVAVLVAEMCASIGVHAEVVKGRLKAPGDAIDSDMAAHPNHWWNTVIIDGEWRMLDCSLASPTNPQRSRYSSTAGPAAESWWFLARPMEICYTHVPLLPEHQHIVPPIAHDVLLALPCACPPYFKNNCQLTEFDTSILHLENLELAQIQLFVSEDVECVAEVEVKTFARDMDGDVFESGETTSKSALCQADWFSGQKRFTIKALLPGDEGSGVLKVYAGKKGLMHSVKSNPHALALALPLTHGGQNPPYSFVLRHPTPHAQRHDLYVVQPQCGRLVANNTFVFAIRQHAASTMMPPESSATLGRSTPNPYNRPSSAMSMMSGSVTASNYSGSSGSNPSTSSSNSTMSNGQKPAKLAIQSPSGKIIRLTRKLENSNSRGGEKHDGTDWETVIKVGEHGTWRGLVLADRSARWCVFAEWECD